MSMKVLLLLKGCHSGCGLPVLAKEAHIRQKFFDAILSFSASSGIGSIYS